MKVPLVMFATRGPLTRNEVVAYAISDEVAAQRPHRSRLVVRLAEGDADLDAMIVHELTHLLVGEIVLPEQPGVVGLPRWGPASIRRFVNALIVPCVDKTYDALLDLTPADFDAAIQYVERRFAPVAR